ncbi:hypothetical protein A374_02464 [Fictibacillus macauensis ZFHKF-1]|uniref:Uncharacterized protein n=1 Tax=Fictibacillus macauensis ZFHKF-1 TaxID=1196324 RepID=I8UJM5_9BACL|nr:hypothetical protein [Fictibacillus macauensis]EIT87080.1 hypothetical protein A374_02464 [Fictibacillus macauensis ZFHKF-1]
MFIVVIGIGVFYWPSFSGTLITIGRFCVGTLLVGLMIDGVVNKKGYEARGKERNVYMVLMFAGLFLGMMSLD